MHVPLKDDFMPPPPDHISQLHATSTELILLKFLRVYEIRLQTISLNQLSSRDHAFLGTKTNSVVEVSPLNLVHVNL